jgi:hypothetical protein
MDASRIAVEVPVTLKHESGMYEAHTSWVAASGAVIVTGMHTFAGDVLECRIDLVGSGRTVYAPARVERVGVANGKAREVAVRFTAMKAEETKALREWMRWRVAQALKPAVPARSENDGPGPQLPAAPWEAGASLAASGHASPPTEAKSSAVIADTDDPPTESEAFEPPEQPLAEIGADFSGAVLTWTSERLFWKSWRLELVHRSIRLGWTGPSPHRGKKVPVSMKFPDGTGHDCTGKVVAFGRTWVALELELSRADYDRIERCAGG